MLYSEIKQKKKEEEYEEIVYLFFTNKREILFVQMYIFIFALLPNMK